MGTTAEPAPDDPPPDDPDVKPADYCKIYITIYSPNFILT